jgi:hypothetical protein
MRLIVTMIVALAFTSAASAQQPAPSSGQSQPPAASSAPASQSAVPADDDDDDMPAERSARSPRKPDPKRTVCREKARQQGLRGQQLIDSLQICYEEARLSCTKKAIEQKIPNRERREYVRNCSG